MEVIGYKRGNIDCNDYFSASLQKFTVIKNCKIKRRVRAYEKYWGK